MYPANYFSLVPPFPRKDRAFVAMSFDSRFDRRWTEVLVPALAAIRHSENPVEAFRVDLSKASDAILTEILEAIGDSLVIVSDITATAELDGRAVRNANVMYEVGLAHATRLPEEVVLFRSDDLRLDFDIAGVRVHSYSPDADPAVARRLVTETVVASLNALAARRRMILRVTAERLTLSAVALLLQAAAEDRLPHPQTRTIGQALGAIERTQSIQLLLEVGAIKANLVRVTPAMLAGPQDNQILDAPMVDYTLAPFGRALLEYVASEMGAFDPEVKAHIEKLMAEGKPEGGPNKRMQLAAPQL